MPASAGWLGTTSPSQARCTDIFRNERNNAPRSCILRGKSLWSREITQPYTLALAARSDGQGPLESLAHCETNPTGAAIVNAVGTIRQVVVANPTL